MAEFYSKTDLQTEFMCSLCKCEFDIPKVLPCGESICTICESQYFKESKRKNCELCEDYHDMPANGFPINNFIQRLRAKTPKKVYRGTLHEKAENKMNQIGKLNQKYENDLSNVDSIATDYCDLMRHSIDLRAESVIDAIQKHREQLLSEVEEFKKKCTGKSMNVNQFKTFLKQSNKCHSTWVNLINRVDINDKEIEGVLNEINEWAGKFNYHRKQLDISIFGTRKLKFHENVYNIDSNVIGTLTELISGCINLLDNKPKLEIYYDHHKSYMYSDECILYVDNQNFYMVALFVDDNERKYFKFIFTNDGKQVTERREELSKKNHKFDAVWYKDTIIIQACLLNESRVLQKYNNNFDLIKSVDVDFEKSTIFTDNEKIYAYSSVNGNLYIFDDELNVLETIEDNNGKSYPFVSNKDSSIDLKYDRLFIYHDFVLKVVDNETRKMIKTIKMGREYSSQIITVIPTSRETFMIIDLHHKFAEVFDHDLKCIKKSFRIKDFEDISKVSLYGSNLIVVYNEYRKVAKLF